MNHIGPTIATVAIWASVAISSIFIGEAVVAVSIFALFATMTIWGVAT